MAKDKTFYLVHIVGGVENDIVGSGHTSYTGVLHQARKFVKEPSYKDERDGISYLVVQDGKRPLMGSFANAELEEDDNMKIELDGYCYRCCVVHLDGKCPNIG